MKLFTKQKQTHREETYSYPGGGCRGGLVSEFETDMYILVYFKWMANKDLLHSMWSFVQYYVTT